MVNKKIKKFNTGLLIGRFQPLHRGHLHLIKKSFQYIEKMIIGIGSVDKMDKDNFLTYEKRKRILEVGLNLEVEAKKVIKIVPLKDFNNDELWLENSIKTAGKFNVIIGNNEWTNGIFEKAGYKVLRLGFYKRYLYEGMKVRKLISENKTWKQRVPSQIVELLDNYIAKK